MKPNTLKWLEKKGWNKNRVCEIDRNVAYLAQDSWSIFPIASQFLKSFDDLGEFSKEVFGDESFNINTLMLGCIYGSSWKSYANKVEIYLNLKLYPVGHQDYSAFLLERMLVYMR